MGRLARYLAALAVCLTAAFAVDFTALKPQGYVSDFAGVVDAGAKEQLERYCTRVETATGAQIALVTLPTLQGEPVEDVANSLFRAWGIGKKGKDEGILLLLVIGDHKSRLEVGYGLEPIIPDGFAMDYHYVATPVLDPKFAQPRPVTFTEMTDPCHQARSSSSPGSIFQTRVAWSVKSTPFR